MACKLFSIYIPHGSNSTHYDGELEAINKALSQLLHHIHPFQNAVPFCDSLPAIQSIHQHSATSKRINDIHQALKLLSQLDKKIIIQWILSHCGIEDNELADMLAKKWQKLNKQQLLRFLFIQENS